MEDCKKHVFWKVFLHPTNVWAILDEAQIRAVTGAALLESLDVLLEIEKRWMQVEHGREACHG